jgi:hypothetical protein
MATQADVRRIALSLPQTEEVANRFAFSVRNKGKVKGSVPTMTVRELEPLIEKAWRCQAPKDLKG